MTFDDVIINKHLAEFEQNYQSYKKNASDSIDDIVARYSDANNISIYGRCFETALREKRKQ